MFTWYIKQRSKVAATLKEYSHLLTSGLGDGKGLAAENGEVAARESLLGRIQNSHRNERTEPLCSLWPARSNFLTRKLGEGNTPY